MMALSGMKGMSSWRSHRDATAVLYVRDTHGSDKLLPCCERQLTWLETAYFFVIPQILSPNRRCSVDLELERRQDVIVP